MVSYNDPHGNHRFILPDAALLADLNDDLTGLNGQMLPDPGVDISSTSQDQANFVIFSPHPADITGGNLFVEYIDGDGNVLHEDVYTADYAPGPTVVPVTVAESPTARSPSGCADNDPGTTRRTWRSETSSPLGRPSSDAGPSMIEASTWIETDRSVSSDSFRSSSRNSRPDR